MARLSKGLLLAAIASAVAFAVLGVLRAQDAKATLEAATKALGDVNTIQYSGSGSNNAYGQAFKPGDPWPAFKVTSYTATVDYKAPAMRVELDRTNPDGVVRGGGGLPLLAPQRQNQNVSGKAAWNVAAPPGGGAPAANPAQATVNDRLILLWTTPHGAIKAAQQNNATLAGKVALVHRARHAVQGHPRRRQPGSKGRDTGRRSRYSATSSPRRRIQRIETSAA